MKTQYAEYKVSKVRVCEQPASLDCCTPDDVVTLFNNGPRKSDWYDEDKECLVVFALNTKLKCTQFFLIALGSLNECVARIAEILRPLIVVNAHSFVLCHIHPSNDVHPSQADIDLTRRLNEAARTMGTRLQDHVIVGGSDTKVRYSFREGGLI